MPRLNTVWMAVATPDGPVSNCRAQAGEDLLAQNFKRCGGWATARNHTLSLTYTYTRARTFNLVLVREWKAVVRNSACRAHLRPESKGLYPLVAVILGQDGADVRDSGGVAVGAVQVVQGRGRARVAVG